MVCWRASYLFNIQVSPPVWLRNFSSTFVGGHSSPLNTSPRAYLGSWRPGQKVGMYILVYMSVYTLVYVPVLVNVPNQPVAEETRVLYSYSGHLLPVPLQQPPCSHCNNRMCIPSKLLDVMSPQLAPLHAPLPRCSEGRQTPLVGAYVHTVRKSQRCRHCSISRTSQAACGSRGGCCGPKGVRCPSPAQGRQRVNMAAISAVYVRHCGIGSCPGGGTIGLDSICVQNHHGLADG